jgi:putative transposase
MTSPSVSYKRHRFPPAVIAHAVWVYFRFPLGLLLVEEMLHERCIVVSYETVRRWAMKFGRDYARRLKPKRASRRDIWRLDEVVVTIGGKQHWPWLAVDQDGYILDEIVQTQRDTKAAKRLLTRLLKKQGCPPRRMITDKLGSYAAARRQVMPAIEHRSHKGLNNRAENSHRLCDDASGRCRAFDLRQACSGSSPSSPPSAIPSLRPYRPSSSPQRRGAVEGRGRHRRLSRSCSRDRFPALHGQLMSQCPHPSGRSADFDTTVTLRAPFSREPDPHA